MPPTIPDKPTLDGLEAKWSARWRDEGTFRFDRTKSRDEIYSIDTPPPTVSGSLHPGHCCSYTHTDITARYFRMRGREVFYPMGWDDNSLNVVRRVTINYGVTCDPTLPYVEGFEPPGEGNRVPVSRPNFVELCLKLTTELEQAYEELWTTLGFSVDWSQTYTTIGERAQRASQKGFLNLLERGLAYTAEAPTVWDIDFQTAVAQAEIQDREMPGAYHRLAFHRGDGGDLHIETTRPELVPACVAVVAHPDDARYQPLFGTTVTTPLFSVPVPVVAHHLADPEKGSGIAMICTFGDMTDVTWWRELGLPVRNVVGRDGRFVPDVEWGSDEWPSTDAATARERYAELAGKTSKQAQKRIVELLAETGELVGEPKAITHPVKFWENGTRPLEIVTNRQWFIHNGGRDAALREALLERGRALQWHPPYMQVRFENWVNGLTGDWNITRQLPFGVPIPLWYAIGADGAIDWEHPLVPTAEQLPIDPTTDAPDGYTETQRGQPGGFVGDPNVMDTWATSSLSPQIVGGWADDPDLFARVFPYDLRPQAHDIIRTWLFYTVLRSHFEHDSLPWTDAAISGFVTDPDRKKLSKSAGNSPDEPMQLIADHGADPVRYWAASGRPGTDVILDRNQFKIGRRLAIKLLNASKFVLSRLGDEATTGAVTNPLDASMLARLAEVVADATAAFDGYDYTRALERTEEFFWTFCDDYVELVKNRAYGALGDEGAASAGRSLAEALSVLLRLFAPFLVYTTEEVWSWWQEGSVHRAPWPDAGSVTALCGDATDRDLLAAAAAILGEIRKTKTQAQRSMRAAVARVVVRDAPGRIDALRHVVADLREAGNVAVIELEATDGEPSIEVELADEAA